MNDIIVGNVCSLCAMVTDSISSTRKKHQDILAVQILSQVFYGVGSVLLRGYSSTAQNVVAILRNLAAIKNLQNKIIEWILILLGVVLGIAFNNRGLIGWLPIVSNFEYSVAVFRFRDKEKWLKAAFLVNMLLYVIFNVIIFNYVGAVANLIVLVTTAVSLLRGTAQK